jgi:ligand-binding SRPBCC domain-containing protein
LPTRYVGGTIYRMSKVTLTTELPIPAETAGAIARKPELMKYVLGPLLHVYRLDVPDRVDVGTQGSARFWLFGIIPGWTHHLTVKQLDPTEIFTNEYGGPVRTWNHRLTFEPIDDDSCRYTDEIETDDGWRGAPTRLFIRLMFRHRHRRWHRLSRILSST